MDLDDQARIHSALRATDELFGIQTATDGEEEYILTGDPIIDYFEVAWARGEEDIDMDISNDDAREKLREYGYQ